MSQEPELALCYTHPPATAGLRSESEEGLSVGRRGKGLLHQQHPTQPSPAQANLSEQNLSTSNPRRPRPLSLTAQPCQAVGTS